MTDQKLPEQIGKYRIQAILGRGAMGVVYQGLDPHIERRVAIKVIRKGAFAEDELHEALQRFRREAQAAGRLLHPNIVTIYEYGEEKDTAFIAMEYVEGDTLKDRLAGRRPFTLAEIADILDQLLTGLGYAHAGGIVHRDIKPDNLIFGPDNTLKIMDFGVARLESSSLTMAGSVMGTPSYMAPEMFTGEAIDQRSDLFSAGIILYQLLTGSKPFAAPSMTVIMHQVVNVMPPGPSQMNSRLAKPLDKLIATCLAKNPAERFQNAADFRTALQQAFARLDGSLSVTPDDPAAASHNEATCFAPGQAQQRPQGGRFRQGRLPLILGAAALLLALIIGLLLLQDDTTPLSPPPREPAAISSGPTKEPVVNAPPRTITPAATKKETPHRRETAPTGIRITSPTTEPQQDRRQDEPASRNAITITVPQR